MPWRGHKIKKILFFAATATTLLATTAASCGIQPPTDPNKPTGPITTITFWSVFDDSQVIQPIIDSYRSVNPNVEIQYRKLEVTEYEDELQRATLDGRGPDIFSVHNSWMPKYQNRLEPVAANDVNLSLFPAVVQQDALINNQVYGLPLSIDTMTMFYNPSVFNSAGVVFPPKTWDEFDAAVKKMTIRSNADITRSGAAVGTVNTVNRGIDPLVLLMLQNGVQMTNDAHSEATFANTVAQDGSKPGLAALNKFLSYSDTSKDTYTWSDNVGTAFDAFGKGQVGILFNYAFNLKRIQALNPNIDVRTAPVPQLNSNKPANLANYWLQGVSNRSQHLAEAWQFLLYMTTTPDVAKGYAERAQKPAALNSLLDTQKSDRVFASFATQAASATSWYQKDPAANESALRSMVNDILTGKNTTENALQLTETQITNLMR